MKYNQNEKNIMNIGLKTFGSLRCRPRTEYENHSSHNMRLIIVVFRHTTLILDVLKGQWLDLGTNDYLKTKPFFYSLFLCRFLLSLLLFSVYLFLT